MGLPDDNADMMATEGQDHYDALGRSHWYLVGRYRLTLAMCRDHFPADGWIVDVGCGPGCLMEELPDHDRLLGVDLAARALSYAKAAGHERLTRANVLQLPFATDSMPFVFAQDIIEHIVEDQQGLSELGRVLKPGGCLFVCVPAFELLRGKHDDLFGHQRRYRVHEIRAKIQRAGLRVLKISYVQALFFPMLLVFRYWKNLAGSEACDFKPMKGPFNAFLTWLVALERHWLRISQMPFGCNIMCVARKPERRAGA